VSAVRHPARDRANPASAGPRGVGCPPRGRTPRTPRTPRAPFRGAGSRAGSGGLAATTAARPAGRRPTLARFGGGDGTAAGPSAQRSRRPPGGRGGPLTRQAGPAPKDRTARTSRAVTLSNENALSRFRVPSTPHPPPCGPQRAAHGRPRAGWSRWPQPASARPRPAATKCGGGWPTPARAARPSPPATRPATTCTTCLPGWPTGAGSTHNSAGRPSRPWAREWWEGWAANPHHSPRTLQAAEARLRRYLRRLGLSDDGEAWLAASAAARAREARWIAREELRTGTMAA
jgi:hypothetical protein